MPSYRLPGLPEDEPGRSRVLPWVEIPPRHLGSSRRGRRNGTIRRVPLRRRPRRADQRGYSPCSPRGTGCSTNASTRFAMNRAVRTTEPLRVTSLTSTTPRRTAVSTRRPARLATTSYVRVVSPASTTISTQSPFTVPIPLLMRSFEITHARTERGWPRFRPTSPGSQVPLTIRRPTHARPLSTTGRQSVSCAPQTDGSGRQRLGLPHQGLGKGPPHRR